MDGAGAAERVDMTPDDGNGPRPEDFGRIEFEPLEKQGTAADRRRILRTQVVLFLVTLLVAAVLVVAVQVQVALGVLIEEWVAVYVILGVSVPVAHAHMASLAHKGRLDEVRHWTWLLLPVHLVWGSGLLVQVHEATPIGFGLVLFDIMVLVWLRGIGPDG